MSYELWDTASGNLLGAYTTESEALAVVAEFVAGYRSRRAQRLEWLTLLRSGMPPGQARVADGPALVDRALGRPEPAPRRPTRRHKPTAA